MNRTFLYICLFVFYSFSFSQQHYSRMSRYGFEVNTKPAIFYNTFISYNNGQKLYFSLDIQNDILQFKKNNDIYEAKYDISINLKDFEEKQTLFSESWSENVKQFNFNRTNSKSEYQNSTKSFNVKLNAGKYKLFVELRDAQTGKDFYNKRVIKIRKQPDNKIKHGELVFVRNEQVKNPDDIKIKSLRNIVELNQSLLVMFEYETQNPDSLKILSELFRIAEDKKDELINNTIFTKKPNDGFNYFIEKIDNSKIPEGQYIQKYDVTQGENKFALSDTFQVIWFDKPVYLYKYDLAIRPMKYLLTEEEYERIEDLSIEEMEIWFKKYWKEKDGTPNTPLNEVQNEFYSRVERSIRKFSLRFKEGWRTQRGETLILYGEPDRVDRHHHVAGSKPYEIWYYDNLNKKITFVDERNNDDFKIVSIENLEDEK